MPRSPARNAAACDLSGRISAPTTHPLSFCPMGGWRSPQQAGFARAVQRLAAPRKNRPRRACWKHRGLCRRRQASHPASSYRLSAVGGRSWGRMRPGGQLGGFQPAFQPLGWWSDS